MREPYKAVITDATISNATYTHNTYLDAMLERAEQLSEDAQRKQRREAGFCRLCYPGYGAGRIGGAMSTIVLCGLCDKELHFGSTCVDKLCADCAKAHGLCKHCGADIDLKQRRKLWLNKTS